MPGYLLSQRCPRLCVCRHQLWPSSGLEPRTQATRSTRFVRSLSQPLPSSLTPIRSSLTRRVAPIVHIVLRRRLIIFATAVGEIFMWAWRTDRAASVLSSSARDTSISSIHALACSRDVGFDTGTVLFTRKPGQIVAVDMTKSAANVTRTSVLFQLQDPDDAMLTPPLHHLLVDETFIYCALRNVVFAYDRKLGAMASSWRHEREDGDCTCKSLLLTTDGVVMVFPDAFFYLSRTADSPFECVGGAKLEHSVTSLVPFGPFSIGLLDHCVWCMFADDGRKLQVVPVPHNTPLTSVCGTFARISMSSHGFNKLLHTHVFGISGTRIVSMAVLTQR